MSFDSSSALVARLLKENSELRAQIAVLQAQLREATRSQYN